MAPSTRSTKRVAEQQPQQQKAAKVAKKPQPTQQQTMLAAVSDAIERFGELPESCRGMLLSVLPTCFETPLDTRSEQQTLFVGMIGEVVDGVQASMKLAVDAADASIVEIESSKDGLEGKVIEAEAAVAAATEVATARDATLAENTKAAASAKEVLSQAQAAKLEAETVLGRALPEKEGIETAIEVDLKALNGSESEAGSAKKHIAVLLALAKDAGLDGSLVTSIPSACTKTPSTRGTFDLMVMEQLEKSLNDKVAELTAKLASGAEDAAVHTTKVEDAQSAFDAAEASSQAATEEARSAHAAVSEAEAASKVAKDAVTDFEPTLKKAMDDRVEKQGSLEQFVTWNVACFTTLRDRASKPTSEKVAADTEAEAVSQTVEKAADLAAEAPGVEAVAQCGA